MYVETPLIRSGYLNAFLKLENTQPSGSFKSRGITNLIEKQLTKNSKVFSSSGGNAGLAAAEAASSLNLECVVVVPKTTKQRMKDRIEKYGANVVQYGDIFQEADNYLKQLIKNEKDTKPIYCHAFDNELIWEGHSTIVDEIIRQMLITPSAIVLSCGGGGLYIGVMIGLERHGLADKVKVYVVETFGAASFHESLKNKRQIFLNEITTVATSLGSVYVPQRAIDYAIKYNSESVLVSDEEALNAVKQFASDHCMIVEPACAATLASIYTGKVPNSPGLVAVVCGGTSYGFDDILSI